MDEVEYRKKKKKKTGALWRQWCEIAEDSNKKKENKIRELRKDRTTSDGKKGNATSDNGGDGKTKAKGLVLPEQRRKK